jgi:hypothetical protein
MPVLRFPSGTHHSRFSRADTSPWWARPADYAGWKNRLWLFGSVCVAIVWTAEKLDRTLAIVLGVLALGVVGFVIWLRYRDDEL